MAFQRYQITAPTIAMFPDAGRHVASLVPVDAIIQVEGVLDGDRLTNVVLNDQDVMMFTQDLRSRAVLLKEAKSRKAGIG